MVFGNQDPAKVGPKVEESLRKDLKLNAPLEYTTTAGDAGKTSAASVVGDMAGALFGGHSDLLFSIDASIPTPPGTAVKALVFRQGVGAYVGSLVYTFTMNRTTAAPVTLDAPKMFGSPKFSGDPTAAGKLNAAGDLAKRLNKFARTEVDLGALTVKSPRIIQLTPEGTGTRLVVGTLPKPVNMGMSFSLDAKEFCDLASSVEKALN